MKTRHVCFHKKHKIFYEVSILIHQMQKGVSTIIKQMLQDHERMRKKETSLLKINIVIPILASPFLVHKLLKKIKPNENVNINLKNLVPKYLQKNDAMNRILKFIQIKFIMCKKVITRYMNNE
jgi:hypothetical protein